MALRGSSPPRARPCQKKKPTRTGWLFYWKAPMHNGGLRSRTLLTTNFESDHAHAQQRSRPRTAGAEAVQRDRPHQDQLPGLPAENVFGARRAGPADYLPARFRRERQRPEQGEGVGAAGDRRKGPGLSVHGGVAAGAGWRMVARQPAERHDRRGAGQVQRRPQPRLPHRPEHGRLRRLGPGDQLSGLLCGHRAGLRRRQHDPHRTAQACADLGVPRQEG